MQFLEVSNLCKNFGGLQAIKNVSFNVAENEIIGLIGPNGAGKTTFFNCLTGSYTATAGTINLNGQETTKLKPHQVADKGMIRTFQANRFFPELTVFENVILGVDQRSKTPVWLEMLNIGGARQEKEQAKKKVLEILNFVSLAEEQNILGKNLPHGSQRRLAIAIALACEPIMLLLDEPATGMNPEETLQLMKLIRKISQMGTTILLIEHDMKLVMNICGRVVVINHGEKIAEGAPQEIANNPQVIEAYLGRGSLL